MYLERQVALKDVFSFSKGMFWILLLRMGFRVEKCVVTARVSRGLGMEEEVEKKVWVGAIYYKG